MFNFFSWFTRPGKSENLQQERVFKLWEEIEKCEKTYNHKKDLGDKLLAQADDVDNLLLPFVEKMARKEVFLKLAKDNFDKADVCNQKLASLAAELRLEIQNVRC